MFLPTNMALAFIHHLLIESHAAGTVTDAGIFALSIEAASYDTPA